MKNGMCIRCNSRKIIPSLSIIEHGVMDMPRLLTAQIDQKPNAMFRTNIYSTPLQAWVCGECGYTEFYVENPQELYQAYRVSKINDGLDDPLNEAQ